MPKKTYFCTGCGETTALPTVHGSQLPPLIPPTNPPILKQIPQSAHDIHTPLTFSSPISNKTLVFWIKGAVLLRHTHPHATRAVGICARAFTRDRHLPGPAASAPSTEVRHTERQHLCINSSQLVSGQHD